MNFDKSQRPRVLDGGRRRYSCSTYVTKVARRAHLLPEHVPHQIIGDVVRFTLAFNPGAAFSMSLGDELALHLRRVRGRRARHAVAAVSRRAAPGDVMRVLALGLAWGGAAGNLIDRFREPRGVVDFIDIGVGDVRFWTFNVADSAVTVGALMLAWCSGARIASSVAREPPRPPARARARWTSDAARRASRTGRVSDAGAGRRMRVTSSSRPPTLRASTSSSPAQLDLSRNQAATLIANGHVLVDGRRERASYRPPRASGSSVEIPRSAGRESSARTIPLDVVFEDDDVLVVDKPAGMVVHPAPGNWIGHPRERAQGARRAAVRRSARRAGRGSSTGSTRRRPGSCSSPRPTARTGCSGAALRPAQIVRRYAALCWGHLDARTGSRSTSRSRAIRETESAWQSSVPDGRRRTDLTRLARFDSADLLAGAPAIPGARIRSGCISRRSDIRSSVTTPTAEAAGASS